MIVDLPGTYSLMSNSEEEEIARDYICFGNPDCTIVVVDSTCLERNLNLVYQALEITPNVVVCVNLLDEAKKKKIKLNLPLLSEILGVPVVGTTARKPKTLKKLQEAVFDICSKKIIPKPKKIKYVPIIEYSILTLQSEIEKVYTDSYLSRWITLKIIDGDKKIITSIEDTFKININENELINKKLEEIYVVLLKNNIPKDCFKDKIISSIVFKCEEVCKEVCYFQKSDYNSLNKKIDKILTSKIWGIPIMLLFLGVIFWLTITGANYPSGALSNFFGVIQEKLLIWFDIIGSPKWLTDVLVLGMYQTTAWVIAVMLPPMAIFFPLFTIMEDLGYLPRISFNLDNFFKKACTTGKQALTMCMGFGCNAAGVVGARIIDSPREKLIAILTNSFVPCNGRFPFLITIATIFIGSFFTGVSASLISTLCVLGVIVLGIYITLLISKILSKTILKGMPSSYILELPPYRKPQIGKVIIRSIFDRTLFVLGRAVAIAAPWRSK